MLAIPLPRKMSIRDFHIHIPINQATTNTKEDSSLSNIPKVETKIIISTVIEVERSNKTYLEAAVKRETVLLEI